mmetsp:Transcript_36745/g.86148  ORF Transcript_36745/g.86148 Transcript_36745/m.86148 type:complete len:256 (-) Transcript_36745:3827-4594(-)
MGEAELLETMCKLAIRIFARATEEVVAKLGLGQVWCRHHLFLRVCKWTSRTQLAPILLVEDAWLCLVELCTVLRREHRVHGADSPLRGYRVRYHHRCIAILFVGVLPPMDDVVLHTLDFGGCDSAGTLVLLAQPIEKHREGRVNEVHQRISRTLARMPLYWEEEEIVRPEQAPHVQLFSEGFRLEFWRQAGHQDRCDGLGEWKLWVISSELAIVTSNGLAPLGFSPLFGARTPFLDGRHAWYTHRHAWQTTYPCW